MENENKEVSTESLDVVDKAVQAAQRIEEANKKAEELLKQQTELMTRAALGGKSYGGQAPEKPKELTPIEYAREVSTGRINPFNYG